MDPKSSQNYVWLVQKGLGRRAIEAVAKFTIITGTTISGAVIGIICGAAAGYVAGATLGQTAGFLFTHLAFDGVSKAQYLEAAYQYLGVTPSTSDAEITAVYKRRALLEHPDKPTGSHDTFCKLQSCYEMIVQARAEESQVREDEFDLADDFNFDEDEYVFVQNFEYLPLVRV